MSSSLGFLDSVETFKSLSGDERAALEARLAPIAVARGACLVTEGEAADALYVVVSGRFAVEVSGSPGPVAEIAQGSTIGEIAFFTDGPRTATVSAIRDSVVVRLTRDDFDAISTRSPAIWRSVTATLARRLADETRKGSALRNVTVARARPRPRTIALVRAGPAPIPPVFLTAFDEAARRRPQTLVISSATVGDHVSGDGLNTLSATQALNDLEARFDTIVFVADAELTPWSEKAIRQADEILLVGVQLDAPLAAPVALNTLERFAQAIHAKAAHRLVLVHSRARVVQGTRFWLQGRDPAMHHPAALGDASDVARLWRFVIGEAVGFVACGGGAYCAAHIGLYKALRETGAELDLFGGTSGGAAMTAAFAQDVPADEIDARVHRMFIEGKALSRYTLPRYSLLDHTHFDHHLIAEYGGVLIEDMWKPYFAVSTDLSNTRTEVHRSGPLWAAIRASAAIPALLPPYYTKDGRMLVDGSVVSNVPIETMHSLKRGPNIVVSFSPPEGQRFDVDYAALPARRDLVWRTLNPFAKDALPKAPSAATVLVRSLMANRTHFERHLEADDWLLMPPVPKEMGALDWRRHSELVETAYRYGLSEITRRKASA